MRDCPDPPSPQSLPYVREAAGPKHVASTPATSMVISLIGDRAPDSDFVYVRFKEVEDRSDQRGPSNRVRLELHSMRCLVGGKGGGNCEQHG